MRVSKLSLLSLQQINIDRLKKKYKRGTASVNGEGIRRGSLQSASGKRGCLQPLLEWEAGSGGADAGHFSKTVSQRPYPIATTIDDYPVHQTTSAGAA